MREEKASRAGLVYQLNLSEKRLRIFDSHVSEIETEFLQLQKDRKRILSRMDNQIRIKTNIAKLLNEEQYNNGMVVQKAKVQKRQ